MHKQFHSWRYPGGTLDAVVIIVDVVGEALETISPCAFTLATPARSTSACPVPDNGTA